MTMKRPFLALLAAGVWLAGTAAQALEYCYPTLIPETNPTSIYQVHGDGTVTDMRTGLMWKQCLEGQTGADCSGGSATGMNWVTALNHAGSHSFAGYSDWRLPNIKELESLVEYRCYPKINMEVFKNAQPKEVWSGSPWAAAVNYAWYVDFSFIGFNGVNTFDGRTTLFHVRLVRGGQSFALLPVLSAVALQGTPTTSSATLAGTSSQTGTGWWLAVPQGSVAPTAAQVKDPAANGYGVTPAAQGNGPMTASVPAVINLTGLSPATTYDFYLVAEASGQSSAVAGPVTFTTAALGACGSAHDTGTTALLTSAPTANLCAAGSTASAVTGGTSTWGWTCTAGSTVACQAPRGYTVTPVAGTGGSISPSTALIMAYGAAPSFTVTPSSGYGIASVSGCGGSLTGSSYATGAITADCTVTASFSPLPASSISAVASPVAGGSVSCSPNPVPQGGNASCTATANPGYSFVGWTGSCSGTANPCTLTNVTAPASVTAQFAQVIPTLREWAMLLMMGLLGLGAVLVRRRR